MKDYTLTITVLKTYTITLAAESEDAARSKGNLLSSGTIAADGSLQSIETNVDSVETL